MNIYDNYKSIIDSINEKALKCSRDPNSIRVVAVSKTFSSDTVQEAVNSGIKLFGENKIQEAKNKIPLIKGDFEFHMVGHLQSNKSKDAVKLFSLIHSIDSLSTAEKLNREAENSAKIQNILIQINSSGEDTKSGISPDQAVDFAGSIIELKNLNLKGIMTIGPLTDNISDIIKSFSLTAKTMERANRELSINLTEISMGMSDDYLIAIEEGSTLVRIGSAIFGGRSYL
jgi:pyridoxal phosphate enzyme (YggS family)